MTNDSKPDSVTEATVQRFQAAWQEGTPQPIEAFLPPREHPTYLRMLERLVACELEMRWQRWRHGSASEETVARPDLLEAYLDRFPALQQPALLQRLLLHEYRLRHRYGDQPELSEYSTRFPQAPLGEQNVETLLHGQDTQGWQASQPHAKPAGEPAATSYPHIPGYDIVQVLGRGGMGVVYQAWQVGLQRLVALKMIRAGAHASPEELARFQAEATAVAKLHHPNIVQIHDVGQHDGCPYFSLEYVAGGTLGKQLNKAPQPARACGQIVEALARAVHHAHTHHIVHRDLKPANILLTLPAEPPATPGQHWSHHAVPKITDFGLAKRLEEEAGQTHTGAVMGTPAYMAPEQAFGQSKDAGPAVDVYALGVILYEMLTGRPPFVGESTLEVLEQVRTCEPARPSKLQPKVHRDLETICLKALAKEPARRYESALALAEDLARFSAGEPIQARPESTLSRAVRRMYKQKVTVLTVTFAALLLVVGGVFWHWSQRSRDVQALTDRLADAIRAPRADAAYLDAVQADLNALAELDPSRVEHYRQRFRDGLAEFKNGVIVNETTARVVAALRAPEANLAYIDKVNADLAVLTQRDPGRVGAYRESFHVRLTEHLNEAIAKATLAAQLDQLEATVEHMARFEPARMQDPRRFLKQRRQGWNAQFLLSARTPEQLAMFEPGAVSIEQDSLVRRSGTHSAVVCTSQPSPACCELKATFDAGWEESAELGVMLNAVRALTLPITALAFAPDGNAIAAACGAPDKIGELKVWDLVTGKERFSYLPTKPGLMSLTYLADGGSLLVACDGDPQVLLLDPVTGQRQQALTPPGSQGVTGLARSRDGRTLATAALLGENGSAIHLWDIPGWKVRKTLGGFKDQVCRLAFAPNGHYLGGAVQHSVRLWDLRTDQMLLQSRPLHLNWTSSLLFSDDSKTFIAAFNPTEQAGAVLHAVQHFNLADSKVKPVDMGYHAGGLTAMCLAPNGHTVAVATCWGAGGINTYDLTSGLQRVWLRSAPHGSQVAEMTYSPDGMVLATGMKDGAVYLWRTRDSQLTRKFANDAYGFYLRPHLLSTAGEKRGTGLLKDCRQGKHFFLLTITRGERVLHEQKVSAELIAKGSLHLVARRDGGKLSLQVNYGTPLEFTDLDPLPATGAFALAWPRQAGLQRLEALCKKLAEAPSDLERGDDCFYRADYPEALARYLKHVAQPLSPELTQEARLKAALCELKLQQIEDACKRLDKLALENGQGWPAAAGCTLLRLHVEQGRVREAEHVFDTLIGNHKPDVLAALVAKDFREQMLQMYNWDVSEAHMAIRPYRETWNQLERADKISRYFELPLTSRQQLRMAQVRCYHLQGKLDDALRTAEELLSDDTSDRQLVLEKICWILRDMGQPAAALQRVNEHLQGEVTEKHLRLLTIRAQIHIALKQWPAAEQDYNEFFKQLTKTALVNYDLYADACLALGFLREQRGDVSGAQDIWTRGMYSSYLHKVWAEPPQSQATAESAILLNVPGAALLRGTILAALTGRLTAAEADQLLKAITSRRTEETSMGKLAAVAPTPPGTFRDMWLTPLGRKCARSMGFHDVTYAEHLRLPIVLIGVDTVHRSALPGPLAPDDAEILWQMGDRAFRAYLDEKLLLFPHAKVLGDVWKNEAAVFGWKHIEDQLQPDLRGPLAYVLGHRYLRHKNASGAPLTAEARRYFETALRDAPPNSALRRRAQAELDRLKQP